MSYFHCNYFKFVNKKYIFQKKVLQLLSFSHVSDIFDSKKIKSKLIRLTESNINILLIIYKNYYCILFNNIIFAKILDLPIQSNIERIISNDIQQQDPVSLYNNNKSNILIDDVSNSEVAAGK